MPEIVHIPIDLACFLRAAELAHAIDPRFSLADVADIEAAWQIDDLDHTSFGWVMALTGGRRFYLAYMMEDAEAGRPEDVNIESMAEAQPLPAVERGVDWYKPEHIARHLGLR